MGDSLRSDSILEQLLEEMHQLRLILSGRLGSLENSVCFLNNTCNDVVTKVDGLGILMQRTHDTIQTTDNTISNNEGTSSSNSATTLSTDGNTGVLATSEGVLCLPGVETYPDGTWLGDPENVNTRVRSPITPQNLLHINSTCVTAEKMALTLLDYLFSRDELASSNISGRSRNNKKQLDPMMVYGIRCHLNYKFGTTTKEWGRICQNMDSKCRSAWKRKMKTMASNQQSQPPHKIIKVCPIRSKESPLTDDISFDFDHLNSSNLDLSCVKVMNDSELRILHSGSNSYDTHEIVLAEDRILTAAAAEEKDGLIMSRSNISLRAISADLPPSLNTSVAGRSHQSGVTVSHVHHQHHHQLSSSEQLQQCSLPSSSISLQECTDRSLDSGEGVIVITGDTPPDDNILEIAVADSLHQLNDSSQMNDPSDDPLQDSSHHLHHSVTQMRDTPPSYKLQPYPPLQLQSSTNKHEMNDQDISDDLDEPMNGIHSTTLRHLSISSLSVIRDKDIKNESSLDD